MYTDLVRGCGLCVVNSFVNSHPPMEFQKVFRRTHVSSYVSMAVHYAAGMDPAYVV